MELEPIQFNNDLIVLKINVSGQAYVPKNILKFFGNNEVFEFASYKNEANVIYMLPAKDDSIASKVTIAERDSRYFIQLGRVLKAAKIIYRIKGVSLGVSIADKQKKILKLEVYETE